MTVVQFARLAQALAINGVLILGLITGRWTAATTLALYWFENLVSGILVTLRVLIHRLLTHDGGHYAAGALSGSKLTILPGVAISSIGFTIGHAIFLAVIIGGLQDQHLGDLRFDEFVRGAMPIIAFLLLGFILDLPSIKRKPFAWVEIISSAMMLRVVVIQLVVVVGLGLMMVFNSPWAAFYLFLACKIPVDLLLSLVKQPTAARSPEAPRA